jgi:hypothetical protein
VNAGRLGRAHVRKPNPEQYERHSADPRFRYSLGVFCFQRVELCVSGWRHSAHSKALPGPVAFLESFSALINWAVELEYQKAGCP